MVSPILEEPAVPAIPLSRHPGASVSPFGSQTASTESNQTIRMGATPLIRGSSSSSSNSYPFPSMVLGSGTPVGTPGLHKPFTALSPTGNPSPMKIAKGQTSREFMTSGYLAPSMKTLPHSSDGAAGSFAQGMGPNLYDVMLRIQAEPGLTAFWSHTTQVLRECYGAERVSLAVPSDNTDIENVPWAQLATFNIGDDDALSRVTNDPQSAQGSLNETNSPESTGRDSASDRRASPTNQRNVAFSGAVGRTSRPTIESRHSFAGYPPKSPSLNQDFSALPTPLRRPVGPRAGSHMSLRGGRPVEDSSLRSVQLNAEWLERHDSEAPSGPLSEDTYMTNRPILGRVLSTLQPLELEADPLITSAGIVKVLDRCKIITLTREYLDESQSLEAKASRQRQRHGGGMIIWPTPSNQAFQSKSNEGANLRTANLPQRPRSQTSGSSGSSSVPGGSSEGSRCSIPYEDYEQIPASPWTQSPAPSPAVQADPENNPFFANIAIDEEAFAERPPAHNYTVDQAIPAIGIDKASSVIHIPLIHSHLSHLRRPRRVLTERGGNQRASAHEKAPSASLVKAGSLSRDTHAENNNRVPIAILSVLSPMAPYPPFLTESLQKLAPLLATSFYNSRQYYSLETEVHGLSRRRLAMDLKSGLRDQQPMTNIAGTIGHYYQDARDLSFSPSGTSSMTASEYSSLSMHSPRGSHGGHSVVDSPGWPARESLFLPGSMSTNSPNHEHLPHDGYFSVNTPQTTHTDKNRHATPSKDAVAEAQRGEDDSKRNHGAHHTRGADLKATSPSLPSAATVSTLENQPGGEHKMSRNLEYMFKDPTHSMLKIMIDNGATQQFIAEAGSGSIVWANSKFQSYRSESAAEIHRKPWNNIYRKDQKSFKKAWTKALLTGGQVSEQVRLKRFDGEYRWFHIRILPLKDKYQIIKHWHGQAMDIHDQYIAEVDAAREKEKATSEAKYRAIANSNPYSIFAASVPSGITFANTQWLSYSGQTFQEALGFGFAHHVHPDDLHKCRFPGLDDLIQTGMSYSSKPALVRTSSSKSSNNGSDKTSLTDETLKAIESPPGTPSIRVQAPNSLLRSLVKDGTIKCFKDGQGHLSVTTEMRLRSRSGTYRWHLVQGSLIESVNFGSGDAEWFIACADITDQKESEGKLKLANDALEKEMSRKMEYLSSMSHEIRTPLNGILGNLQFLNNSGLDEHQQDWTFGAQKAAQGMHELINDILDVSKAEAKMLKLTLSWFRPRSVIEEVMETLMSKATEKGIELCYEIADSVPTTIRGDSGRIKQILLNLVGNAVKFTRQGEVWVKCDMFDHEATAAPHRELGPHEIFVRFSVKDTGTGFSDDEKQLLFKSYSQIDNKDTRNIGGTGLGLILCRTMVELHGGEIDTESVPGKGSTFTFYARFHMRESESESASSQASGVASVLPSPAATQYARILPGSVTESPGSVLRSSAYSSPALQSTGSSIPSTGSRMFERSLQSSSSTIETVASMKLTLPSDESSGNDATLDGSAATTRSPPRSNASLLSSQSASRLSTAQADRFRPPILSILIICPQENTRRTTHDHIQRILPKSIPAQISTEGDIETGHRTISGDHSITFSHVVLQLGSATEVLAFMDEIFGSTVHAHTCMVIVTDQTQKAAIKAGAPPSDFNRWSQEGRLVFILKPAKPHKFAKIFDPEQENAESNDDQTRLELREKQRQQKTSYAFFKQVLGHQGFRVLAVEDNQLNMEVGSFFF